jgi:hypothetical protein
MKTSKARLLIATVLLIFSLSVNAQKIRFGVFADPQLSWFTSDTKKFSQNGAVFGLNAGFSFERFFADRYAITTGVSINSIGGNLLYKEAGYKIATRDSLYEMGAYTNAKISVQYLSIPLGFKFKTNEIGYSTFYAQLGVRGDIRLKGYAWIEDYDVDKEVIDSEQTNFGFISYMIGGGIEYSLGGPSSLQFGVNYSNGMTPAYKAGYGRISLGNVSLRIGVVF